MSLVSEFIPEEIIPFIWFGGIATTIYVFFHKFSDVIKEKFRQTNLTRKRIESHSSSDTQVDDLIKGAPRLLNELNSEIAKQRAQGVTDEQMSGLIKKQKMLELVANNKEIIDIVGKPIIKKVLGLIGSI